jgi:flagellar basal-body rod protein FlgB
MLKAEVGKSTSMNQTHHMHISGNSGADGELLYRTPLQPSIDGNTVDSQSEIAEFSKNTLAFQSTFQFLNSKFKGLTSAIRGD